ncbi:MAG: tRNA-dihydrouridine synthase [Comamonadaceae bacterium]|nr:tRNA-dihydrouridine synthase [Comamonadaceae bacterium]
MKLLLAPMEGLLDCVLRDLLTRVGGVDRCVSEFIRVTGTLLPERVFLRTMPELRHGSRTLAGVPVRAQLLGSDPVSMAENAARLAALGAEGVDLNFGCPAKVVNRHGGGAALLRDPAQIEAVVAAVRRAVPARVPVSAKMRLGYDDDALARECAQAMASGGAGELVVHARTKADGYRPPAYWERIPAIRAAVPIPVVANGEIWTVQDAQRCRALSGCDALMLGRGAVADPGLALAIRAADGAAAQAEGLPWPALVPHLVQFWQMVGQRVTPRHRAGRLKQWLNLLRRRYPEAQQAFDQLRTLNDCRAVTDWVARLQDQAQGWAQDRAVPQSPAPGRR